MQKTLYLFRSGRLRRKENTLAIETEEQRRYFPVENVRDIFVFGEVDLNKKVLEFLCENEILVHFFDYYGHYVGSFYPREHYNSGYMILRQAEHYLDPVKRLTLARQFVAGALENIVQVLRYYANRGKDLAEPIAAVEGFLATNLPACGTVEELMAVEGNGACPRYRGISVAAFFFAIFRPFPPSWNFLVQQ